MRRFILFFFTLLLLGVNAHAQKAEVLYFKAELSCCRERACTALENELKAFVENQFKNGEVVFKTVKISDPSNATLVQKHNAASQSVVVVTRGRRSEKSEDLSDLVKKYTLNRNKTDFETAFLDKVNQTIR
jgi:hypothetical protein